MSGSVDSRVTTMKFDNAQFQRGAAETMSTLDKLKKMLSFENSGKGLENVQKAANGINLRPVDAQLTGIKGSLLAIGSIAATVFSRLTNAAINAGKSVFRGMFDPLKDGLREYETTLNSVQTILANTNGEGIKDVNAALDELNTYSDKTIYNFGEMAKNIGTFTAAGIKLDPAVEAIKGISNLAALSGSNAQQASTAMYQLSQALAAGKVSLMDWNSVVNAGMGGKVFQKALVQTARATGVAVDDIIKEAGSFRASISKGWVTDDILTKTLRTFTGDLTRQQLKAMGYEKSVINGILKRAKTAQDAATKVKTFTQLIGTLQEAAGSGWAQTWRLIFGDFKEARSLWTGVSDVLGGFVKDSADARNKVVGDWKELGGRTVLIEAIANAFHAVMNIVKPIKEAFRDIFPATTGKNLFDMTVALRDFTAGLEAGEGTMNGIRDTFRGVFAVLDIGWEIVKGIVGSFFNLFTAVDGGGGSVLKLTGGLGDALVALHKWLIEGGRLDAFFDKFNVAFAILSPLVGMFIRLAAATAAFMDGGIDGFVEEINRQFSEVAPIVSVVATTFQDVANTIRGVLQSVDLGGIFDGFSFGANKAVDKLELVNVAFEETADTTSKVGDGIEKVKDAFSAIGSFISSFVSGIGHAFGVVKDKLGEFFEGLGVEDTLAVINTGFFIAVYIAFRRFLGKMGKIADSLSGTFDATKNVLNQVTSNLKSMQTEVRAKAILEIAAALALLAAALFVLSKINVDDLAASLGAVAVLLTMLTTAILVLEKKTDAFGGAARVAVLAGALVLLGAAMLAMAGAVAILAQLDTNELVKGVGALAVILASVSGFAIALEKGGGAGQMVLAATSLLILAAALTALAGAMKLYASIDTKTLLEGGVKVAATLGALSLIMRTMPKDMVKNAAALFIVANALVILSGALKIMGGMSIEEMGKSLIMLGGSLLIISAGLKAMAGTVKSSAALLIFAAALAVMTPSLVILGNMDVDQIAKALGTLAGVFAILGAAAYLLAPVVPVIFLLAKSVALLGLAVALIGGGLLAFSIGLATLAASGAAGIAVLSAAVIAMAELFPLLMHQFGLGLRALAVVIAKSGPELVAAFSTVLGSLIKAVIVNTPKLARMLIVLIDNGLRVLVNAVPKMVRAGIEIVLGIMRGVRDNIGKFVKTATEIYTAWLRAWGKNIPKLADEALKFIIALVNGIADAIDKNTAQLLAAGVNLATSLIQGIVNGLKDSVSLGKVVEAAKGVAKSALNAAKKFLGIASPSKEFMKLGKFVNEGFANGMVGSLDKVQNAMDKWNDLIGSSIDAAKAEIEDLKAELKDLNEHPTKNADKIAEVTKQLEKQEALLKRSTDARRVYNKDLADERKELRGLAKSYDDYTARIEDARSELKKAQDDFASFQESTTGKFGTLPEIDEETTIQSYEDSLAAADAANEKFLASLNQLVAMGLDDASYQKLLDEGVGIQPFIDQLVAQGPDAVAAINRLTAELGASAAAIGSAAAIELKQAGVDAAAGFLQGLIEERAAVEQEMSVLAKSIVKAIKKALKIKSPSKVMEPVGKFTVMGLANGLDKHASLVETSAEGVANTAVDAIKSTLQKVAGSVDAQINTDPVIRPVLDLTQLNKDAGAMGKMLDKSAFAQASFGQASAISNQQAAKVAEAVEAMQAVKDQPPIVLEQNNYSPKALSRSEIYRDTKNLLSTAKEALNKS